MGGIFWVEYFGWDILVEYFGWNILGEVFRFNNWVSYLSGTQEVGWEKLVILY